MIAILTGDIVNSQKTNPNHWLTALKKALMEQGHEKADWEIFRGDSFQLEIAASQALKAAFLIKAHLKQHKDTDVRIAIGIGQKDYAASTITQSNGSAFVYSGNCFDELKKNRLAIKSADDDFDKTINLMLHLYALTSDNWTPVSAQIIKTALGHSPFKQHTLANTLNKSQSNISSGLKRGGFDELTQLITYYSYHFSE